MPEEEDEKEADNVASRVLAELDVELGSKMLGIDAPSKAPPSKWGRSPPRRKRGRSWTRCPT